MKITKWVAVFFSLFILKIRPEADFYAQAAADLPLPNVRPV